MTRKLAIFIGGVLGGLVLALLTTLPVLADGGPHSPSTGTSIRAGCASCHRSHTAQAPNLLKEAQPALCLDCHGDTAQGAGTNVEGGVYYSSHDPRGGTVLPLRGGGFKYALIDTTIKPGSPGGPTSTTDGTTGKSGATSLYQNTTAIAGGFIGVLTNANRRTAASAHQIDPNVDVTMWGYGANDASAAGDPGRANSRITCGSCHDPHGNGKYRILRPIPREAGSLGPVSLSSVDIADTPSASKSYTTTNYWNVAETATVASNISSWCSQCHTRYLAGSGSATNANNQNGVVDTIFKYRHTTATTAAYQPNCLQCHVSHGSDAVENARALSGGGYVVSPAMEFPWPGQKDGAVWDVATQGSKSPDSRLLRLDDRAVCQMCHLK